MVCSVDFGSGVCSSVPRRTDQPLLKSVTPPMQLDFNLKVEVKRLGVMMKCNGGVHSRVVNGVVVQLIFFQMPYELLVLAASRM